MFHPMGTTNYHVPKVITLENGHVCWWVGLKWDVVMKLMYVWKDGMRPECRISSTDRGY